MCTVILTKAASTASIGIAALVVGLAAETATAASPSSSYWPETRANHQLLGHRVISQSDIGQARSNLAFYVDQCNQLKASGAPAYEIHDQCGSGSQLQQAENQVTAALKGLPIINADCTGVGRSTADYRYNHFRCIVFTHGYSPTIPAHFYSSHLALTARGASTFTVSNVVATGCWLDLARSTAC